ncbi:TMV resistance protein N-like protein isoform X1, partial [Tanacetum coccineum]
YTLCTTTIDGASTSSSSSLTPAQTGRWTYDVFVSFRGKDTRNNFVDHLYAALDQAGIHTFKDDKKLIKGKPITPELAKAMEESMVAVVVFSKNYANSCWCLEELVKIIECRNQMGQIVLPVFYDVAPSDVRRQGSFLDPFESHKLNLIGNMEKLNRWKGALVTAANLAGCNVPQTASGHEAECIKQIVQYCLRYTEIQPAENLIGMESRMRHVKSLLGKRSGNVCIIGIWGMGEIGKTTFSRAVYRRISYDFDGSSFLDNVREIGSDETGLKSLQEKLLLEIRMQ